jgi:hypothetical protein
LEFNHSTELINSYIYEYLCNEEDLSKTVRKAMNEAVKNGGKRVRPLLMLETYKLISKNEDISFVVPFMAAIEFIHTFSLIHDDLPCIDNDELRRGQKSTWARFGEDMAVLAGDALSVEAFDIIAKAMEKEEDMSRLKLMTRAFSILSDKTGINGMIGGQTVDVEKTGRDLTKEELEYIYRLKTGALIEASMTIGAVLAGATNEETNIIKKIALNIGMAFQVKDDILDEVSSSKELGKPVHSDENNNKNTYVKIYGLENSKKYLEDLSSEAISMLDVFSGNKENMKNIINWLIDRKN